MSGKKVRSHEDGVRLARYRDEFEHPSVFGVWKSTHIMSDKQWGLREHKDKVNRIYVIYSYGSHFPMYAYDEVSGEWVGNSDKYSRTTSSHQSKYRPSEVAKWFDTATLNEVVTLGLVGYITNRMENGVQV